jgi:hypothetical protein
VTIQQIIQTAMSQGAVTYVQEHRLNTLLFHTDLTPGDLFLLKRFTRSLAEGSVVRLQQVDSITVGEFGRPYLRVVSRSNSESCLPLQNPQVG